MKLTIRKLKTVAVTVMTGSILVLLFQTSPQASAIIDEGGAIFKAKCAACHGADGSGNTTAGKNLKIRDLRSAEVQSQSDAVLFKIISSGKGKMPAYGKSLDEGKIHQLVAFVRTLRK